MYEFFDRFCGTFLGVVEETHKCLCIERSSCLNVGTEQEQGGVLEGTHT